MAQRFFALMFFLVVMLASATPAEAHANIVRSTPTPGSTVETAPAEIVLEFSEELDPAFSRVRLFDSTNKVINEGPGTVGPASPRVLRLAPGELPRGTYTAIWRVRSTVDGHVTEGNLPFGIGVAVSTTSLIPPPNTPEPATMPVPAGSGFIRWLNLLSAALMLGVIPFALFVWRPVFQAQSGKGDKETRKRGDKEASPKPFSPQSPLLVPPISSLGSAQRATDDGQRTADERMLFALRRIIVVGGALLGAAGVLFLVDQAAAAAGVLWGEALGRPLWQLLGSRTGILLIVRLGLASVLMVLATRLPAPGARAGWSWWLALALGAALLATFSLNSHGAAEAQGAVLATLVDWLHIAATTAWIGGLLPLAVALWYARTGRERTLPLGALIPRFSLMSVTCVVTLAASGTYSYFLHVGDLHLLLDTTYGRALSFKLVLFGLLVVFGAWNMLVLSPGLRKANTSLARSFRRTVIVELVIGAAVLGAVGAMTSVAPSRTAWAEQEKLGLVREASAPGVNMRLQVAPAQIGDNEFAVDIQDKRAGAQDKPAKVLLRFDMQGMQMGQLESQLSGGENGRYLARGNYLSMGGRWNVEVILRRAGFEDVRQQFEMDIVKSAQSGEQ